MQKVDNIKYHMRVHHYLFNDKSDNDGKVCNVTRSYIAHMITIFLINYDRSGLQNEEEGGGVKGCIVCNTVTNMALKELAHVNREHCGFYLIIDQYHIVNFL